MKVQPSQLQRENLRKKIDRYSYGLHDIIGEGFNSVVYHGHVETTKQSVAVKVVDKTTIKNKAQERMLEQEIEVLKKINHPNIIRCHDVVHTANNIYIFSEYCEGGDLQKLLKVKGLFKEQEASSLISQILSGYFHLSQIGILHCDLKPANILLKDRNVKIADFGFARKASGQEGKNQPNVGSPLYMSPQALKMSKYSMKNDVWALGVTIYELLHGRTPWTASSEKQLLEEITKTPLKINRDIGEDTRNFISRCLIVDYSQRISPEEMAKHPFVRRISERSENIPPQRQPKISVEPLETKIPQAPTAVNTPKESPRSTQVKFNWLSFLLKFLKLFPDVSESGRYTLGLRCLAVKQLLCIKQSILKETEGDSNGKVKQKSQLESKMGRLENECEANWKDFQSWVPYARRDRRLSSVMNKEMCDLEMLTMLGIKYAIEECKDLWKTLQASSSKVCEEGMRLDFTMTYLQLCWLLVDDVSNWESFGKLSKLDLILSCEALKLDESSLPQLGNKFMALNLLK